MADRKIEGTDLSQADRFREAARQLETDDDEARFDRTLAKVVRKKMPLPPKKVDDDE